MDFDHSFEQITKTAYWLNINWFVSIWTDIYAVISISLRRDLYPKFYLLRFINFIIFIGKCVVMFLFCALNISCFLYSRFKGKLNDITKKLVRIFDIISVERLKYLNILSVDLRKMRKTYVFKLIIARCCHNIIWYTECYTCEDNFCFIIRTNTKLRW